MANEPSLYHAFLLRVWQVESDGKLTWRASLENVHTGERHGFASPELLFTFIKELVGDDLRHSISAWEPSRRSEEG